MTGGDVFIVDDNPDNLNLLSQILRKEGYQVRMANTGRMALNTIRAHPPEIIMLDIKMPDLSGYEVCETLKDDVATSGLPVIFISALDDPLDKVRAFKAGGRDYVMKPFHPEEVVARVENQLRISRLEKELARQNAELARKNQQLSCLMDEKNRFVGMAVHDLRHPITIVKGYLGLLIGGFMGDIPEAQLQIMRTIDVACESMLALIDDLLDVSMVEAGRLDLDLAPVDLHLFLEECVESNSPLAKGKRIELTLEGASDLPIVHMDAKRVHQVINNLISNAIKFSHPDSRIELRAVTGEGEVNISVADQGQGIPADEIPRIFSEFGRISVRPTGGEKSTGLGLAIVKRIVEAHGGRIRVESEVKKGSTFTISLPTTR